MGTYNGPIQDINILQLDRPLGFPAPQFWKSFRLKEWQAFQLNNQDWFICLSVYNTKLSALAIVMAFNKAEQKMVRYQHQVSPNKVSVPMGLGNTRCYYRSDNFSIEIDNNLDQQRIDISLNATNFEKQPDLKGKFTAHHSTEPIVIVQPFSKNRPLYSHKALMPLEGELSFEGNVSQFDRSNACAIVDDHKGYYPFTMKYDWLTSLGRNSAGDLLGFNLTDNQIQQPEKYNENCLWKDGKMIPLPPITIKRPNGIEQAWIIKDKYGWVDLRFTPLADVVNKRHLGLFKVDYHGPTGLLSGKIMPPNTGAVSFDGFYGMGEQKLIRM